MSLLPFFPCNDDQEIKKSFKSICNIIQRRSNAQHIILWYTVNREARVFPRYQTKLGEVNGKMQLQLLK